CIHRSLGAGRSAPGSERASRSAAAGEGLSHRDFRRKYARSTRAARQRSLATGLARAGLRGGDKHHPGVPLHGRERRPPPRAGGNITGLTNLTIDIAGKRLELFKAAVPTLTRIAVLYDAANPGNVLHAQAVQTAGHALGVTVQLQEIRGLDDFERVFAALRE